jgi:hypothetical protein
VVNNSFGFCLGEQVDHLGGVRNQSHSGGAIGNSILVNSGCDRDGFDSSRAKQSEAGR